jgi:hypothetical protein
MKMTVQHTPGPWFHKRDSYNEYGATVAHLIETEYEDVVATVSYRERDPRLNRHGEADAALIASAPDLLAVAKRWERYASDLGWADDAGSFLEETRAAIAKSEGQA